MKKKILWVDDEPEVPLAGQSESPEQILKRIYKGKYNLLKAKNFTEAAAIIQADNSIRLVLMDIHIKPSATEKQGQYIARELYKINRNLKFIVLTSFDGDNREISLGEAGARIAHVLKNELCNKKEFLLNLSSAVLEDFENKTWKFEWDYSNTKLWVKNKSKKINHSVGFSGFNGAFLEYCLNSNQKMFDRGDLARDLSPNSPSVERLTSYVNERLREQTNGRLWGMFVRGARGEIVMAAPNVEIIAPAKKGASSAISVPGTGAVVGVPAAGGAAQSDLERRIKECEDKITHLLKLLGGRKRK